MFVRIASPLALAVILAVAATSRAAAQPVQVDLELVLAVDISGSVDEDEATLQRQGYLAAMSSPEVVAAVQAGPLGRIAMVYMEWSGDDHQETLIDWAMVQDAESARAFVEGLTEAPFRTGRWTSISAAIDYSVALFDGNGYRSSRQVIDISGDGYNNRGRQVTAARDEAVAAGITINGLPILNQRPSPGGGWPAATNLHEYYEKNVIGGPGAFTVAAEGFDDFARAILAKLVLEIAGLPPERDPAPARHLALLAE